MNVEFGDRHKSYRSLVRLCACLAAAAAAGAVTTLADTRLVSISLLVLPVGVASFLLYRRYVGRQMPVTAILGSWLVALASATATFNGIRIVRNATLADILLLAGALVLIVAFLTARWNWPTYSLAGAIGATLLGLSVAASTAVSQTAGQDLLAGVFFLVGSVLTPLVVAAAARSPAALEAIAFLWLTSGAVNGAISAIDSAGITTLGPTVTGLSFFERSAGLTVHPNHLGLACAMVVPIGVALILSVPRIPIRVLSAALTALAVIGVLESGSRGATLGVAIGPAVAVLLVSRRRIRTLAVAAVLIIAVASLGAFVAPDSASVARLTGQVPVQGSDLQRTDALTQSLHDFTTSPIVGTGYGYARDAHDIYLQVAAAGGAVGLIGLLLLLGAIVQSGVQCTMRSGLSLRLRGLAAGSVGALVTWLSVGIVENPIYDRYLYWPAGLLLAVGFLTRSNHQIERATRGSDLDHIARDGVRLPHATKGLERGG